MNQKLPASKRDWTGLACTVGMGLLVLLAWATLPRIPAGKSVQDGSRTKLGTPFATPLVDAHSPDLPVPSRAAPEISTRS